MTFISAENPETCSFIPEACLIRLCWIQPFYSANPYVEILKVKPNKV